MQRAAVSLGGFAAARRDGMVDGRQSATRYIRATRWKSISPRICLIQAGGWPHGLRSRARRVPFPEGNGFTLQTPDAANISSVVLVRNGAVTHAFGMDQRLVGLSFTAGSGSLTVTAPPTGNIAPPGYYMLFILNSRGVPSVARMVQLFRPMVGAVSPNNGHDGGWDSGDDHGNDFASGATVTLGGTAATNVVVVNSTTITATTPAAHAGARNVTVTNHGGQTGSLTNGFTYNASSSDQFRAGGVGDAANHPRRRCR